MNILNRGNFTRVDRHSSQLLQCSECSVQLFLSYMCLFAMTRSNTLYIAANYRLVGVQRLAVVRYANFMLMPLTMHWEFVAVSFGRTIEECDMCRQCHPGRQWHPSQCLNSGVVAQATSLLSIVLPNPNTPRITATWNNVIMSLRVWFNVQ